MYNSKHWTLLLCTEVTVQNEDVVPRPPASKQNEFKKKEVEGNSIYYFVSINCLKFGGNFAVKSQSFSAVQLMNKRDLFAHDCFFGETLGCIVSLNIYHKTMFSRQIETNPGPAILYRLKWYQIVKNIRNITRYCFQAAPEHDRNVSTTTQVASKEVWIGTKIRRRKFTSTALRRIQVSGRVMQ